MPPRTHIESIGIIVWQLDSKYSHMSCFHRVCHSIRRSISDYQQLRNIMFVCYSSYCVISCHTKAFFVASPWLPSSFTIWREARDTLVHLLSAKIVFCVNMYAWRTLHCEQIRVAAFSLLPSHLQIPDLGDRCAVAWQLRVFLGAGKLASCKRA